MEKPQSIEPSGREESPLKAPHSRLALHLVVLPLLVTSATLGALMFTAWRAMTRLGEMGRTAGIPDGHPYYSFVQDQTRLLSQDLWIASGLALFFSALVFTRTSRKIVHSLLSMREGLRRLAENPTQGVRLPSNGNDYFSDLSNEMNRALDAVEYKNSNVVPLNANLKRTA